MKILIEFYKKQIKGLNIILQLFFNFLLLIIIIGLIGYVTGIINYIIRML